MKKKLILTAILLSLVVTTNAQVGIGTNSPNNSAALEVQSTTKGFLPPRLTQVQILAIASPLEGLLVYCTDCSNKGIYVFDGAIFKHSSSGAATGIATTVVEVVGAGGATWMDRNLGATQKATSSNDPCAYGDLYQWGRFTDGHQSRTSSTRSTNSATDTPGHGDFILVASEPYDWLSPQNDNLWQGVSGINNPCPIGYRLPTQVELNTERLSWNSNNAAGAFASTLKLSVAGYRSYSNGTLTSVGSYGAYWSSTVTSNSYPGYLNFNSSNAGMHNDGRAHGFSVRCIKE